MSKTIREGSVLWVHWPQLQGQTLIGRKDTQPFVDSLIDGVGPDGKTVTEVNFVFSDHAVAAYNCDSLAFARIGVFMAGDPPTKFDPDTPDPGFSVREDAGIPE